MNLTIRSLCWSYCGPIPMLCQQMEQILHNTGAGEMVFEAFDREKVKELILLHCSCCKVCHSEHKYL